MIPVVKSSIKLEIRLSSKSFDDECVVEMMTRNGTLVISRISQILSHTHPPQPRSINIELLLLYNTSDATAATAPTIHQLHPLQWKSLHPLL